MKKSCPYCGNPVLRWRNPRQSTWTGVFQYVCFNDGCPYFVRGWEWMESRYSAHASYRYRLDPQTGESGPLPVWSKNALRSDILEDGDDA